MKYVLVNLEKISDAVDNEVVKNTKFNTLNTKVYNLHQKISAASTFIHINEYNTDKPNLEKKIEMLIKKISDTTGLVTTTVLNTKIGEAENKLMQESLENSNILMYSTHNEGKSVMAKRFIETLKAKTS